MTKQLKRTRQTFRFLRWVRKHGDWWQLICEPGSEHMDIKTMQLLVKRLAKERFYEMIFVLMEVHKNEEFMKSVNKVMMKDLIMSEWKSGHGDGLVRMLVEHLE